RLPVFGASLLLAATENAGQTIDVEPVSYTVSLGRDGLCLGEVNAARLAAGLAEFTQPGPDNTAARLPAADPVDPWKPLCEGLIRMPEDNTSAKSTEYQTSLGGTTYARMPVVSTDPDCTATVNHWKAAFKNFSGLPPSREKNADLYGDPDNVSFVALYNPSPNAYADCRVVTCNELENKPYIDLSSHTMKSNFLPTGNSAHALICLITPDVLQAGEGDPFTQKQWDQIKASLGNSSRATLPSDVIFLAALFFAVLWSL
ncbi:SAG family member, partial [Eimeria tenella]